MSRISPHLHGFRMSWTDVLVLALAAVLTVSLKSRDVELFWIPPVVVGHFFLFCNVFRVRRSYELGWAVLFLGNVACGFFQLSLDWQRPLLCQLPITVAVIVAEMRSWRYHGIFAHCINPSLPEYIAERLSQR